MYAQNAVTSISIVTTPKAPEKVPLSKTEQIRDIKARVARLNFNLLQGEEGVDEQPEGCFTFRGQSEVENPVCTVDVI